MFFWGKHLPIEEATDCYKLAFRYNLARWVARGLHSDDMEALAY